jgi:3-dehydroquinate dehydratase-1
MLQRSGNRSPDPEKFNYMTTRRSGKVVRPQLVAVISSPADLAAAVALKELPDLFELRLDSLSPITDRDEKKISRLRAPLIITARDPREGGIGNLSLKTRRDLLQRFLPRAKYLDVELRAAPEFETLLAQAQKRKVCRILSYHNFESTPSSRSFRAKAKLATTLGADVFKVATRTDSPAALGRLVDFVTNNKIRVAISAMGIGKLGLLSRVLLPRCGSVLNYAHLGRAHVAGQPSLSEIRRWALDVRR